MPIRYPRAIRFGGGGQTRSTVLVEPTSATNYYTVEDLGSGYQLSVLRVGHIIWEFAARSPFLIKTYLSGALSTELSASYFTTQTLNDYGSGFTITYTKAGESSTVVLSGSFSETLGELIMEIDSVVLDSAIFGARSVWSASLEYAVQPSGPKALMCAMLPAFGGIAYRDATTARSTEQVGDYPGYMQDTEPLTDQGGQCGFQLSCCWNHVARSCLAFRRIDADGRGARFRYDGDGSNVLMKFEFFPTNNLATQSVTGTAADGVTLHPLRGHWYEASVWYRDCLEREGSAHIARGKIKDMTGATGHISTSTIATDLVVIMTPGNAFPPTNLTNDATIWGRTVTEISRLVQFFGTSLTYRIHWGTWFANGNNNFQDLYAPVSGFLNAITSVEALGYTLRHDVYMFPNVVDRDSTWYGVVTAALFRSLMLDQSAIVVDASFQSDHNHIQFGSSAGRTAVVELLAVMKTHMPSIDGMYLDTVSGNGPFSDYRSTLTADQKGPGSSYEEAGKKTFLDALRTRYKVTEGVAQFMLLGEFNDEQMLPYIDEQGGFQLDHANFQVTALNFYVPAYRTVYSEYVLGYHYGDALAGYGAAAEVVNWDITGWVQERTFHNGQRLSVAWNGFDTVLFLVSLSTDTGLTALHAATYDTYQYTTLLFMRALVQSYDTLNVRKYQRGRRLHPLPGSVDEVLLRNGYVVTAGPVVPGGSLGTVVEEAEVQSSVWESDETGGIGIILTNHHRDNREFFVSMPHYLYPEINSSRVLVENVNGTRTLVNIKCTDPAMNVVVPPATASGGGIRVFELLTSWP